ncbi:MAG: hypothetical protein PHT31_00510 [Candidatus Omnitrophica bacterium]|nr:hypothetical protein [Candidatus Omnitrophota bacterium]
MRTWFLFLMFSLVFGANYLFSQTGSVPAQANEKVGKIQSRVDELTKELNLTAEQQAKVKQILGKGSQDLRVLMQNARNKAKELRIKAHDEIMAVLTAEQQAKFKVTRKKNETTTLPNQ